MCIRDRDYPEPEKEIERAIGLGLKGMKLHPDTQHVNMDDPRLMNVYEMIEGRLPIVIHTGDYRYDYSHPRRLMNVLKTFPDLVVDAAHFGCWSRYEVGYDIPVSYTHLVHQLHEIAAHQRLAAGQRHLQDAEMCIRDRSWPGRPPRIRALPSA